MCRLFAMKYNHPINIYDIITSFANKCELSREYQGHGWGMTYYDGVEWKTYKSVKPIWKHDFSNFPLIKTAIMHARSAFNNEGIEIENNMPFENEKLGFIFNGELRGVKIKEKGRIGAEKLFNFLQRFMNKDIKNGIEKGMRIITKKTEYIRAANFIILNKANENIYVNSMYNEDTEYFEMYKQVNENGFIISSEKLDGFTWENLNNYRQEVFS